MGLYEWSLKQATEKGFKPIIQAVAHCTKEEEEDIEPKSQGYGNDNGDADEDFAIKTEAFV